MTRSEKTPRAVGIIDDDSGFVTVLCKRLEQAGWQHMVLGSAPPVEEIAAMRLDAVVLNPALLGNAAWGFMQNLGEALPSLGIVVCAQQSSVAQRVRGIRLGADDWIGKPCHPEEVVARIEAVTRRHRRVAMQEVNESGPLTVGELEFRVDRYEVLAAGRPVELTKREYELLLLLARSDGRVLPREDIYQRVWGYAMARGDRSVDVFVRKVRHKLEAASPDWRYVHTHFGIGYRFDAEPLNAATNEPLATAEDRPPAEPAADDRAAKPVAAGSGNAHVARAPARMPAR
jgi:DNA-binding response OmpR family regulator